MPEPIDEQGQYEVLAPAQVFDYFDEKLEGDRLVKENRYNAGCFFTIGSGAVIGLILANQYEFWIGALVVMGLVFIYGLVHILISR